MLENLFEYTSGEQYCTMYTHPDSGVLYCAIIWGPVKSLDIKHVKVNSKLCFRDGEWAHYGFSVTVEVKIVRR